MSFTRKDIRQRVGSAGFCNDTIVSSATGGTTSTLVDTALKQPNDFFNSAEIVPLEGNGANAPRYVTDWVQSTSTFTVDRVWGGVAASGDDYEVHTRFSYANKNEAIKEAQRMAGVRWARRIEDTSLSFSTNTYTYALGSLTVPIDPDIGIDYVLFDTGASGTGVPYAVFDDDLWEIRINGTTYTLQVKDVPRNGATIRLLYRVRPTVLTDDTTNAVPDSTAYFNFLCARACALLFRDQALAAPEGDWVEKADAMEARAELYFNQDKPQPQGGKVRFPPEYAYPNDYLPVNYGL